MIPGITAGARPFTPGGVVLDPNTVSLMHFDGADGSTTFTDEAGIVWTPAGAAQLDTAEAQFGPSSMLCANFGTDWLDATDAAFAVGTGDFTAEGWIRFPALLGNHFLVGMGAGWGAYALTFNGGVAVFDGVASNVIIGAAGQATANTWHHLAWTRLAGTMHLWFNGNDVGGAVQPNNFNVGNIRLGAQTNGNGGIRGWIDEWRFSNVARYTANFTPPAGPLN